MKRRRKVKKICVIRMSSLGDVIQASAALRTVRNKYPDAEITFVVAKGFEIPVLNSPIIDNLVVYNRGGKNLSNFDKLISLIFKLFRNRFDLLIDLHYNRRSRIISFLAMPRRRTPVLGNYLKQSNLERHELFLNRVGIGSPMPPMEFWSGKDDVHFACEFLKRARIESDDLLVGMNPGANWTSKSWPVDFFARVGDYFSQVHGAKTIVFGGLDDREKAVDVYKKMEIKPMLAAGRASFLETGELIRKCNLFITGDTGLMHLARGANVPIVAIFGGTDPRHQTTPLSDNMRVIRDDECQPPCNKYHCPLKTRACLWAVTPEMVIKEAENLLNLKSYSEDTD